MILYEWVYNRGEIAEGVFCSAKCAEDMYIDNPRTRYKGCPSPIDEQESEELVKVGGWKVCYGCREPFVTKVETEKSENVTTNMIVRSCLAAPDEEI